MSHLDSAMAQPVTPPLVTKLHRPRTSAALVPRPRLTDELTAGLSRRPTLVSAPAGYGKTTVVSQWQFYTDAASGEMHARASTWFAVHGLLDEAIVHAVASGDVVRAATLVEDNVHGSLERKEWRQLERWLGLLPREALKRPRLLLAQAWLNYIRYQHGAVGALLEATESAIAREPSAMQGGDTRLHGELNALRAAVAYIQNDADSSVRLADAAMLQLGPEMQYAMGLAGFCKIFGLYLTGQLAAAVQYGHGLVEEAHSRQANSLAMRPLLALANIHYERVELRAVQAVAHTMQRLAEQAGLGLSTAWTHTLLGWAHYQRNNLAAAEKCFRSLVPFAYACHGRAVVDGYTGLVLTLLAQGHPDEALRATAMMRELLLERGLLALASIADSLQQRVLLSGSGSPPADWDFGDVPTPAPGDCWEQPVLTQVRTLLARGTPDDLAQAAVLLADSRSTAAARHSVRRLIEVGALEALVRRAQGDETAALVPLREAVELAAPGGALRLLVDAGPGLVGLLQKLQVAGVAPEYVRQVLDAFAASTGTVAERVPSRGSPGGPASSDSLVETLTNREIDVLILLDARLSDKEIAERLVLAPATVRKHTMHIYGKLGVNNRRAAVAQARRLGLI